MNGCGCLIALIVLCLSFYFGPWAVLGWCLIVLIALALSGAGD